MKLSNSLLKLAAIIYTECKEAVVFQLSFPELKKHCSCKHTSAAVLHIVTPVT